MLGGVGHARPTFFSQSGPIVIQRTFETPHEGDYRSVSIDPTDSRLAGRYRRLSNSAKHFPSLH
ncbi:MAG: hypothetical protein JWO48_2246 [Bryobacterales bacterium]|nr:hypothetical protein [Bryobacterales bacterium]